MHILERHLQASTLASKAQDPDSHQLTAKSTGNETDSQSTWDVWLPQPLEPCSQPHSALKTFSIDQTPIPTSPQSEKDSYQRPPASRACFQSERSEPAGWCRYERRLRSGSPSSLAQSVP